ncbi:hypothetical protein BC835DRAFT_894937 [Cytidiella melzeri]|nr:hypothetical protein BC835DRAFT_894937 [Cytidiella melzeri]
MYLVVALFAATRMYAIWDQDRRIFGFVLGLGSIYPLVNTFYVATLVVSAFPPPITGCGQRSSLNFGGSVSSDEFLFIFGTLFSILFESVVIALTWMKTMDIQIMLQKTGTGLRTRVSYLLLRDGTTYFVTILSLNVLSLLSIRVQVFNNMPSLIDTLTSILVSRFMLNLRDSVSEGSTESGLHMSDMSDVRFASQRSFRLVGNLGNPIHIDDDDEDPVNDCDADIHELPNFAERRTLGVVSVSKVSLRSTGLTLRRAETC